MTKHIPPQRLFPAAPIGSLLKREHAEHAERPAKGMRGPTSSPAHAVLIRQLPCLRCGMEPCGEGAHVKRGLGHWRPPHRLVPLCPGCHRIDADAQHRVGEEAFWGRLGIDPVAVAKRLWEASGDGVRMRAIVFTFIASRDNNPQGGR